jgi:hypothetical protein
MAVFWVVAPCSLAEVYRRFRGGCCLYQFTDVSEVLAASIIVLMIEAARTSETYVKFFKTTRRNNPEDGHLHNRRCENLKSHVTNFVTTYFHHNFY